LSVVFLLDTAKHLQYQGFTNRLPRFDGIAYFTTTEQARLYIPPQRINFSVYISCA
jgi:hypothetical protein